MTDDDNVPRRKRRKDHDKAPKESERLKFPPMLVLLACMRISMYLQHTQAACCSRGPDAELRRVALQEAKSRVLLGPKALPSCCAYTMFNAQT